MLLSLMRISKRGTEVYVLYEYGSGSEAKALKRCRRHVMNDKREYQDYVYENESTKWLCKT